MDRLHLQLQYMICARDAAIAQLQGARVIEQLRVLEGASAAATFDPGPMTFTEPTPADVPVDPPAET